MISVFRGKNIFFGGGGLGLFSGFACCLAGFHVSFRCCFAIE